MSYSDPILEFENSNPKAMQKISVILYLVFSVISILFNRMLLTRVDNVGPYFLNFFQFTFETCVIIFIMAIDKWIFHPFDFEFKKCFKVLPTVAVFTATALLNNKTLSLCPIATYQVVKSLTPLMNILIMFFVYKKKTNSLSFLCCLGVVAGFVCGMLGDKEYRSDLSQKYPTVWPYLGIILGVLSSVAMAAFSISSKKCIALFNGNQWECLQYLIPMTALSFFLISYFTKDILMVTLYPHDRTFYFLHILGGTFLTLLNFSAFLCIKHTSPLTHNVASIVVTVLTTIISYFFMYPKEKMSLLKVVGIVVIIGFSLLYAIVQPSDKENQVDTSRNVEKEYHNEASFD